jgi:selenide,water dikinase
MRPARSPVTTDIVLIGGGHSHVAVLRRFGMRPVEGVRLTLIARDVQAPYSGMLPGYIAGHYGFDEVHIDLEPLARFAGARLLRAEAIGLELAGRRVLCRDRPGVAYDLLSINTGSRPGFSDVPGAEGRVVPVKPIAGFVAHWRRLCERVLGEERPLAIGVVGAGAGGVELLLCVQYRLGRRLAEQGRRADHLSFHLISGTDRILPTHNGRTRSKFERVLAARGVQVHRGHLVVEVDASGVRCANGARIALDEILWVTSARPAAWLEQAGLEVDRAGFVLIDDALRSISHPEVFAAGDVATIAGEPRPRSGVFAVREGPPLAANLRRAVLGQRLRRFRPQRRFLSIITTGERYAIAARGRWALEGHWVWRWKDRIDRRFVQRYRDLPAMAVESGLETLKGPLGARAFRARPELAMRCAGCGAKVGSLALTRALARLAVGQGEGVVIGLDQPDDAAAIEVPPGEVALQTVDFFPALVDDPYVFGQIAANHALGDIYAIGGRPRAALAIVTLPFGPEDKVEEQLFQMLAGGVCVLGAAGTALVGGHTSEAAEPALGFAITGFCDRAHLMRKRGLEPGDRLILTKPLGTGTLLAAAMRREAKGRWLEAALGSMLQSSRTAAEVLKRHGAHACTDVTGFGLLGHLLEMVRPSNVDVRLELASIPVLEGALETARRGILSSLHPANAAAASAARADGQAGHPVWPLLFDPQTAGGLLAAVPEASVGACTAELRSLGYRRTAVIGAVLPRSNHGRPILLAP